MGAYRLFQVVCVEPLGYTRSLLAHPCHISCPCCMLMIHVFFMSVHVHVAGFKAMFVLHAAASHWALLPLGHPTSKLCHLPPPAMAAQSKMPKSTTTNIKKTMKGINATRLPEVLTRFGVATAGMSRALTQQIQRYMIAAVRATSVVTSTPPAYQHAV